jgi:DoxX-like family
VDPVELFGDALRVVLGAVFLWIGYFDLRPSAARREEFRRWGFPSWTQPAGGVLQLASVAMLVLPATVLYGAAILIGMMVFSVYIHLVREYRPVQVPWPLVLGVFAVATGYLYGDVAWGPAGTVFRAIFPHA